MTDFDEMVAFLEKECVESAFMEDNTKKYTLKGRLGIKKDFYVDFQKKKCSMWHIELDNEKIALFSAIYFMGTNFKTHIEIQDELDKFL